ncbi:hypothetical protein SLITO_v1c09570 [Spiroplasma litorale]|uniref:Uncharacterized protein n=1 Tax=Spiroplasma litorale TaxID=216942 RepID=A0A0K1W314_9MOLU|nr:hypothetical protein [Spiroplasma litorale]AKX34568.1 hypothetical protein SLITO_v1c09570 [Spiroplasma litorale]
MKKFMYTILSATTFYLPAQVVVSCDSNNYKVISYDVFLDKNVIVGKDDYISVMIVSGINLYDYKNISFDMYSYNQDKKEYFFKLSDITQNVNAENIFTGKIFIQDQNQLGPVENIEYNIYLDLIFNGKNRFKNKSFPLIYRLK